ncbi:MAG TPA: DinB family protein [Blastocatellia bacterium]|nr:DinB family protein [Blastocatellia bacterium]
MADMNFSELVLSLAETPRIIEQITAEVGPRNLDRRPSEKEWSILEHVCHLRDIEVEGYVVRIERIIGENAPSLADIDGDKLAEERDYIHQDIASALADFVEARRKNVLSVKDLSEVERGRQGVFENVGPVTLDDLLLMMHNHDQEHLKELARLRGALAQN